MMSVTASTSTLQRAAPFNPPPKVSRWSSSPIAMKRLSRPRPTAATWVSRDGGLESVLPAGDKPQMRKASFGRAGSTTQTRTTSVHAGWARWRSLEERPSDIPSSPDDQVDKDTELLSQPGRGVTKEWLPFEEARDYVRSLSLVSKDEWQEWSKSEERPPDIPSSPDRVYKDKGWTSYGDFLGYNEGYAAGRWLSFEEARENVRTLGLASKAEFKEWRKSGEMPPDIPYNPHRVYKDKGWKSWGDFLAGDQ